MTCRKSRIIAKEKGVLFNMNLRKVLLGGTVALSTVIALNFGEVANAQANGEASSWEARTVEQVKADFQEKEDGNKTYTIKYGDTLGVVAKAAGVDVNQLAAFNNIENANLIFPGNELTFNFDANEKVSSVEVKEANGHVETVPVQEAPAQEAAPVQQAAPAPAPAPQAAPVQGGSAKEIIASRESGGSYDARNGRYIGRYQLDASYLNGDFSPANQERVADQYVAGRYGSWDAALAFWNANGWY